MARIEIRKYLAVDSRVCGGRLIFKGTRIPVADALDMIEAGCTPEGISKQYRGLVAPAAVREARSLILRKGGADSGRDIEAIFSVTNLLVSTYDEKWFIECKHHSKGISPEGINSKIAWADAEKPKHFVIMTSSYLTNNARTWLEKIRVDKSYKIHVIEGKQLKKLSLSFPELIAKYFIDEYSKLLVNARKAWSAHNLLPEPQALFILFKNSDPRKLLKEDLAFLWCVFHIKHQEIEDWCTDQLNDAFLENEPFSFDFLFEYLCSESDGETSVINQDDNFSLPPYPSSGGMTTMWTNDKPQVMYCCVRDKKFGTLEVLLKADENFSTKIRYVPKTQKDLD